MGIRHVVGILRIAARNLQTKTMSVIAIAGITTTSYDPLIMRIASIAETHFAASRYTLVLPAKSQKCRERHPMQQAVRNHGHDLLIGEYR